MASHHAFGYEFFWNSHTTWEKLLVTKRDCVLRAVALFTSAHASPCTTCAACGSCASGYLQMGGTGVRPDNSTLFFSPHSI